MRSLVLSCLFTIVVPVVMVYVTPALPRRDRYHLEAGIAMSEYVIHVITRREPYNSNCFCNRVTNSRKGILCSSILGTLEMHTCIAFVLPFLFFLHRLVSNRTWSKCLAHGWASFRDSNGSIRNYESLDYILYDNLVGVSLWLGKFSLVCNGHTRL